MDDVSGTTEGRLGRRQESEESASSSGADVSVPRISLIRPLVNRRAAVYQIISNSQRISEFPGIADSGESVGKRAVEALLNETIYVNIDLRSFPDFGGKDFKSTLIKKISDKAVDSLSSESELLAKVLKNRKEPKEWLNSLFQVTNKRYLFLFIDEIGMLPSRKFYQFPDLDPQRNPHKPNVYRLFFEILSSFLVLPYVICYLAGRSDGIVTKQEDAITSRVNLDFLCLDPFSEDATKLFIQGMKICTGEIVLQLLFPRHPEGPDWFFKQVYNYTGGVPIYVRHVIQVLVDTCVHNKLYNLSERRMRRLVETVAPMSDIIATPEDMEPKVLSMFCTLLLSSILEYRFAITETIYGGSVNEDESKYVLDIVNNFGFYYKYCSDGILSGDKRKGEEIDEGDIVYEIDEANVPMVKLVYPKIVLKAVKENYKQYPLLRYIYYLFSLHALVEASSSLRFRSKVIFASILYVRCSLSRQLGELSLFHQSFVENIVFNTDMCCVRSVPSFSSELTTKYSADEQSYSLNAWKDLYDKYLSEDGIFLPNKDNSCGPDILVRVSVPIDDGSSSSDEGYSSLTEMFVETSSKKRRVYLIGIALKCYHCSTVSLAMIKNEVDKFLVPVSSQLELEKNDIWAIQLVVSTSYNNEVSSHFVDKLNWVIDTRKKDSSSSSTPSHDMNYSNSDQGGLRIGRNCQLVVCSLDNLEKFLGKEIYDQIQKVCSERENFLTKVTPLSRLIGTLFEHGWARGRSAKPEAYLEKSTEKNIGANRVDSTVKSSSSVVPVRQGQFDWMEFLKTYCNLTESEARESSYRLSRLREQDLEGLDSYLLEVLGIKDRQVRIKIVAGVEKYIESKTNA
ncbi:hypothetical protein GAYE_SCF61G6499 [Galdieria yellowstonensis]|uniref:Archaeal ATPase n=1 Tax=Galdieria yellowstonensis TaxID=3028027 RepID=A0AAV9IMA3_9RHOD|nr:hypothetical protein GAYE_SCF61G6499 [Galdieria yellowstonensis]